MQDLPGLAEDGRGSWQSKQARDVKALAAEAEQDAECTEAVAAGGAVVERAVLFSRRLSDGTSARSRVLVD